MKKTVFVTLAVILISVTAFAVDGVVLINQSAVIAAGGFPYVISQPGSYKLSGNLIVPNLDTTAIRIATDFVTLDLGGFSIIGPNDCSSGTCPRGNGNGIETASGQLHFNITIRNGTIQGMGAYGINLTSDSVLVEYIHARSNGNDGIHLGGVIGFSAVLQTIQYCSAELNNIGLSADGGLIQHNTAGRNRNAGINLLSSGRVSDNVVIGNFIVGLLGGEGIGYSGNVFRDNPRNISGFFPSVNLGQNLCDTTACPGAVF